MGAGSFIGYAPGPTDYAGVWKQSDISQRLRDGTWIEPFVPSMVFAFLPGSLDPAITFDRATNGSYFDSAGVFQLAGPDVARFTHNPATLAPEGLMIEPQRTNSIRNNTMVGAVAGSPGTLPTNWSGIFGSPFEGIVRQIVAVSVVDGIEYIDIRLSGTPTATRAGASFAQFDSSTQIAASVGQTWTASAFATMVAGSYSNVTIQRQVSEHNSGGTFLGATSVAMTSSGGALRTNAGSITHTIANGAAVFVTAKLVVSYTINLPIDITLRIGLPQLELGATASSVIKTSTAAATRAADVATVMLTQTSDILVQDRSGGEWIAGVPAGIYTLAPRTGQTHISRWRSYAAGVAAQAPSLAVAYP